MTKKRVTATVLLGLGLIIAAVRSGAQERVVASGAAVEKLAGKLRVHGGANVRCAGQPLLHRSAQRPHYEVERGRKAVHLLQPAGRANGMYFDGRGQLIAAADEKTALWSVAPDGKVTVILGSYGGKPLNGPNDVWVRPDGAIYFTDPFYKRPWWTHDTMPQDGQHVYFLSADRRQLVRVTTDLEKPNGIIGTPDGKTLYVADIGAGKTFRFDIATNGRLTRKTLVAEQGSDGMTLDTEGNLYLTGKGVRVFDKTGRQIRRDPDSRRGVDSERQLLRPGQANALHHGK